MSKLLSSQPFPEKGLIGIEKLTLIYTFFTLLLALFHLGEMSEALLARVFILLTTFVLVLSYHYRPCRLLYILRVYFQLSLLGFFWYPDIYSFVRFMPNTDHIFAAIDQSIFGFQPSIEFSNFLNGYWWRELFNLGYFSYYLMVITLAVYATSRSMKQLGKTSNLIFCTFASYYVIFLFLQSAGPQFYFEHVGMENILSGVFPNVGDWFQTHSTLTHDHSSGTGGLFTYLVESAQTNERPIAAFPSSHVGVSTVMVFMAYSLNKKMFYLFLPFYCILCLSTVYIGAHYAIDVLGGWITAILVYILAKKICSYNCIEDNGGGE